MNTTQLEAAVRRNGHISDSDPDYDRATILAAAHEQLLSIFSEIVTSSRTERWVHGHDQDITSGKSEYRIHPRAIANGLRDTQIGDASGHFWPLTPLPLERAWEYERGSGTPFGFIPRGDHLRLAPEPGSSSHKLRQYFYMRPPRLIETSTNGRVVSVDGQDIEVNSLDLSVDDEEHTLAEDDAVDVICPSGGFELQAFDLEVSSVASPPVNTITVVGDASRVQVGDYVRLQDTSDYPQLPMELHTALSWATAAQILVEKGDDQAASAAVGKVNDSITRAIKQLSPRVKGKSKIIVNRNSRVRRYGWRQYRS